jgi:hypothetical protein
MIPALRLIDCVTKQRKISDAPDHPDRVHFTLQEACDPARCLSQRMMAPM